MKRTGLLLILSIVIAACSTSKQSASSSIVFDKQGHRGSRGLMPENTIPAMIKAIDLGVTTLEMDVVISNDKKVVVSHDPYFSENITTRPGGQLLTKKEAAELLLYSMPYDSIVRYDVGLKPHPDFPQQQKMAVVKPLLSELLAATESYAKEKGKTIMYNIEIKSRPENDGKKHPPVDEFVDLAIEVIHLMKTTARTTIQSFDPRALQVLHRKYPKIITAMLIEANEKRSLEDQLRQLGYIPKIYSPHFSLVDGTLLQRCHQMGMKVIPWTVNNIDEIKRLKALGVDGIITDYPNLFENL